MSYVANKKKQIVGLAAFGLAVLGLVLGGPGSSALAARKHKQQRSSAGVVNINTATPPQLELLPGIGPSKARSIVRYRTRRKFKATYELIRIRGIGRKTYRRLRVFLTVKGPTTLTERPKRERKPARR